ncbi:hypothetical protein [Rhizobium leguminosarum]|uniref:hypothetical protein n=1 Tax=Rhizobium leguminosarum TaxID=384 RepID=UPI001C96E56F|nr:hypothetical protein [Rhizobium leguminosarum]MBY5379121.1 hypothetical protein [Rhizobium leguminosarum]
MAARFAQLSESSVHGTSDTPPSEGRLGADGAVLFGQHHDQFNLGDLELGFDLAAFGGLDAGIELGPLS